LVPLPNKSEKGKVSGKNEDTECIYSQICIYLKVAFLFKGKGYIRPEILEVEYFSRRHLDFFYISNAKCQLLSSFSVTTPTHTWPSPDAPDIPDNIIDRISPEYRMCIRE
jgi:hypothetical protein